MIRTVWNVCGGGTTDQSSASFCIRKGSVAYDIEIQTAYENGDTDFGGNNLTFRIMQLLKIEAARRIKGTGKGLAERVKKAFFANEQILRIVVSSEESAHRGDTVRIMAPKWNLSAKLGDKLEVQKNFPAIEINTHQVRAVFLADIYDIFRRFVGRLYEDGKLSKYSVVKLTGQSCKIGLFRDSLKEYVPGLLIRQGPSAKPDRYGLKLACLAGAIRYLRDKNLGFARVSIKTERPALPYVLSAFTHDGRKITLIRPLDREHGRIKRSPFAHRIHRRKRSPYAPKTAVSETSI
ncbi:MAG: hypothetical protein LBP73_00260 [Clostridiales Family XIII bacterium]|jgi:hypothetical protein|nr:hypothetical protein [Clostridiales Family XIII bacterium]